MHIVQFKLDHESIICRLSLYKYRIHFICLVINSLVKQSIGFDTLQPSHYRELNDLDLVVL